MEDKKFDEWNEKKKVVNRNEEKLFFREGDVWWVACGKNIGVEINGKNADFARPALVLRKLGVHGAMVVPLTSQKKGWQLVCEI